MSSILPRRTLIGLLLGIVFVSPCPSAEEPEDELKAAVVLSFLRYGEWPAAVAANATLNVGVVGRSSFATVLRKRLDRKLANDHPVRVVDVRSQADEQGCSIIYFADDQSLDTKTALESAAISHVLTIGESKEFLDWGGGVRVFVLDGHITFEVGLETIERTGVAISSRLLRFGQIRSLKRGERL